MLPYAGYVDPESTLAIGVHHDGHLEATERTFCSLYHTFIWLASGQHHAWQQAVEICGRSKPRCTAGALVVNANSGTLSQLAAAAAGLSP